MYIGQKVMLIGTDGFMPPYGSIGFVEALEDEQGGCVVYFPECLCPVEAPEWFIPKIWLLPIDDIKDKVVEESYASAC